MVEQNTLTTTVEPAHATSYKILKQDGATWHSVIDGIEAYSANAAIKAAVSKLAKTDQSGTFVAVPSRSWRPVSVEAKTTVQLELTEVKP